MGRETNKQRRERQATSAREKAAVARAAAQRDAQRRRAQSILGIVVAVAIVGALIAYIAITTANKHQTNLRGSANAQVLGEVTGVTQTTWNGVGAGSTSMLMKAAKSTDPPLTQGGKPELLYVGGEFCPHCAAERWALIQALSRFGTFKGLSEIRSATTDGNIATFSFYKSSYTSKYIAFTPVEAEDRNQAPLEKLSTTQQKTFSEYTQGFPFIDFGGKYVQTLAGINYNDLSGKTQAQIAAALKDPSSTIAKAILGEANNITATLCTLTNNAPSSVCSASAIVGLQGQLGA